MTARRLPRIRELAPLLQFRKPVWNTRERNLANAHSIDDLRRLALRRVPRSVFDYADGGAEAELTMNRTLDAFREIEFHPCALTDVSAVSLETSVLGTPAALPFGIAPTGFTRMMHSDGERAGARAAARAGIPFALSTMGTASIEDVVQTGQASSTSARSWFQLYMWKDRGRSAALIARARDAGMEALILTIDVPVGGRRLRDLHNGMTVPPTLTPRTIVDAIPHTAWWFDFLTTEPLSFAALDSSPARIKDYFESMFDPSVTWDDLEWVRDQWHGPIVVKGVQTRRDARRISSVGVDAIVLSSHGGRQLDRAPVPLDLLPGVVEDLASDSRSTQVWLDSGIRSGADIVAALALGADFTLIGRAYLYGLMAGGERGVDRAIRLLRDQIETTMRLLGVADVAELTTEHATRLRTEAGGRDCTRPPV